MTSEDVRSELEKMPFVPLRIHLVSGKTLEIQLPRSGWMLQNALMILHSDDVIDDPGYDIVALRNIERIEQLRRDVT